MSRRRWLLTICTLSLVGRAAEAQEIPSDLLHALDQAETPDSASSAESTLENLAFDSQSEVANLATMNLELNLYGAVDLHVAMSPLCYQSGNLGSGDTTIRLKWNLWGNDDETAAFALMPYLKLPSASAGLGNGLIEGGIVAPLELGQPEDFGVGLVAQIDLVGDDEGEYRPAFLFTGSLSRSLLGAADAFVELEAVFPTTSIDDAAISVSSGLSYALREEVIIDAEPARA